jgi:hypothetical protein
VEKTIGLLKKAERVVTISGSRTVVVIRAHLLGLALATITIERACGNAITSPTDLRNRPRRLGFAGVR